MFQYDEITNAVVVNLEISHKLLRSSEIGLAKHVHVENCLKWSIMCGSRLLKLNKISMTLGKDKHVPTFSTSGATIQLECSYDVGKIWEVGVTIFFGMKTVRIFNNISNPQQF